MKARDVFAAVADRSGIRRSLTLMGAMVACLAAVGFAAVLGTGAPADGAVTACPNEAIRAQQHAENLGNCRAWEMVSPPDKSGGEVFAEGVNIIASGDGNGVSYLSKTPFGDAGGTGTVGLTDYVARRGSTGWLSHSITPIGRPDALQVLYENTFTELFSDDLSRVFVNAYDLPGATDDIADRRNLYVEDTATRALHTVSAFQRPSEEVFPYQPFEFADSHIYGASADLQHIAFVTPAQLLPANTAPGYPNGAENVYVWDEGVLHLAGILPDGTVPMEGSTVAPLDYRGAMSPDGSRQAFIASPVPGAQRQLYLRIDNSHTAWVSEPEGTDQSEPQDVHFEGMTPNGRTVFFVTDSALVDGDTASGPDLYRWVDGPDPSNEDNLTLITNTGAARYEGEGGGGSLVGMSNDGNIVYTHLKGAKLWVWNHGETKLVAEIGRPASPKAQLTLTASRPGAGRVSPDGRWLAFLEENPTYGSLTGGPMFLFDLQSMNVTCVSCSPAGNDAYLMPQMTKGNRYDYTAARPRFLSNDGQVFFTTSAPLVPDDINGVKDVYEFDGTTGALHLISSGRGSEPSEFADASASGEDVFFVTRQRLGGVDPDTVADLYDARSGGGLAEPEPAATACGGEDCQGGVAATPSGVKAGSSAIRSAGNVKPGRRCGPRKRKVVRDGKTRCLKKQSRQHHRHKPRQAGHRGGRR